MNRFPLLSEFLAGVLDAFVEEVLGEIVNLAGVVLDGDEPVIRRVYLEEREG